jgi:PAS domain S-box-containing protein
MNESLNILMLEDNPSDAEFVNELLIKAQMNFKFILAKDKMTFLHALGQITPDVILSDNSLPQFSALEALEIVQQRSLDIPFILVTGTISEEFAVNIIKLGASDYILKDRMERLPAAIVNAIRQQKAEKESQCAIKEMQRSNERFITLSKATHDAVWDWNLLTNEIWWNDNFYHLLGYRNSNTVPKLSSWIKMVHPLDRKKVLSGLIKIKKHNVSLMENEFRFQLQDGTYGMVQERTYILKDHTGNPVRIIGVLENITEQNRLKQELEVLSIVAKENLNGVIIFDKVSKLTTWINPGFTRDTGYTQSDIYGNDPWLLLTGAETDRNKITFIEDQIENNLPFSCDILIYTKSGETRWELASGQPIYDGSGNVLQYFVIYTDISDNKRLEAESVKNKIDSQKDVTRIILQTQEMERNTLGRELHDNINQILVSISLRLGYYLDEPGQEIDVIENSLQLLQKAILETRKLSHTMVMPSFTQSSLKEELELLIDNYSFKKIVKLQLTGILEKHIPSNIKETLFRIAQEQLSNIAKHAKAGKIAMRLSNDNKAVTMTIKDNGIGFDMQQKRKGIGITNICARVIPYNGTADFLSLPGKGCKLSVTIPLAS